MQSSRNIMRTDPLLSTLALCVGLLGCGDGNADPTGDHGDAGETTDTADTGTTADTGETGDTGDTDDVAQGPPLELTPNLCDDASNIELIMDLLGSDGDGPSFGDVNLEQLQRMMEAPTEGPFYMVNLIRFREKAVYPDGRDTELTGREANALYSPIEFLNAIGARVVFTGGVVGTTLGPEGTWDEVAIVEYPCPIALFAMGAHPEFQARSIHKDAGLEASIVMVTHLQPPGDLAPTETPFPPTVDDPAFELVEVFRHREQAQYPDGSDEPARTGQEAIDLYRSSVREVQAQVGMSPTARLDVQGVFIGDGRAWDEVWIDYVPSQAALNALASDPAVVAAQHHHEAAVEDAYGLMIEPLQSNFPGATGDGGTAMPPVTPDGTGTLCQTDADCPGNGVDTCFTVGDGGGFCTREGCSSGECESPYACCRDCSDAVASMLPFVGSACIPDGLVSQLTAAPASCTCD